MERSHDPIQTELLSRIERRERTEKCKFYTACIILIPLFTLFFAYVYFLLHDVQVSFVWILIFLACMLTLPFVVAFLGRLYQDLILNFLHAKKIFHYHICDGKVNQCHQVFHDMVKKRGLRLSDDVVRHILSFLPRLVRGRRKKSSHDRVFFRRTLILLIYLKTTNNNNNTHTHTHVARHIAIDTSADIAVVSESGKSRLRLMRADLSDPYLDQYLRIREVQNIPFVPEGIAVTSISHGGPWFEREIRIYVTDIVSHRVAMFDVEGRCVWCVGRKGNTPGRFNRPGGCSISNDGPLFVCDTGNNRVQVLCASTGRFLHTMGSEGHGKGRLLEPIDCAVDNKNRLFVVDSLNFRVQVFSTLNGSSLFMWGTSSSLSFLLTFPTNKPTNQYQVREVQVWEDCGDQDAFLYIEVLCTSQSMTIIIVYVKYLRNVQRNM